MTYFERGRGPVFRLWQTFLRLVLRRPETSLEAWTRSLRLINEINLCYINIMYHTRFTTTKVEDIKVTYHQQAHVMLNL